ncbi:MAG TPA: hypothetical protein VGO00_17630, partial [Kofleriaceae bacterium]|nr:hypothetical protein [Kofleriaceae bacterium]
MNRTIALLALYAAACGSKTSSTSTDVASNPSAPVVLHTPDTDGIDLRVSNGKQGAPAYDHTKVAPATKLGDADVTTILKRAAPIKSDLADQQAFALRPRSTPPPRTGTTVHGAFPPPASSLLPPVASDAGKGLEVLRFMPQGAVPLAPELSVTFSQPMVAVTSQTDASKT